MDRRNFIKTSCSFCLVLNAELLFGTLSSCSSFPVYEPSADGKSVNVPTSLFAEKDIQIISIKGMEYNVAIIKEKNNNYAALLLRCTHASTPLNFTGKKFLCPLHGSSFDEEGRVLNGPAVKPLKEFNTHVDKNNVKIFI